MIYARKVLEKNGCIIYLAADIKCLDYHTPCSLTADISGKEYTLSCGDVLLFRNALKPYVRETDKTGHSRESVFSSEDCRTCIYREGAGIYMQIISGNNDDIICSFEVTAGDLAALYKAIDLRWYNRTLPVYR